MLPKFLVSLAALTAAIVTMASVGQFGGSIAPQPTHLASNAGGGGP